MIHHIKRIRNSRPIILIVILSFIFGCTQKTSQNTTAFSGLKENDSREIVNKSFEKKSHDGSWKILDRKKIGGWKTDEKYYYTQQEFEEKYNDLQIEIINDIIRVSNPFNCSSEYKVVPESEMQVSGTSKIDLDSFLQNEFHIDPSTYLGYIPTKCKYPLTNIYVFRDYLMIKEYGAFYYVVSKDEKEPTQTPQENVYCYKIEDEKNYTFSEICEYQETTDLEYLYQQILKKYNPEDVLKKLPTRDTVYSTPNVLEIQYLISRDEIKIHQIFEGGETDYLIYIKEGKGVIEEKLMPD